MRIAFVFFLLLVSCRTRTSSSVERGSQKMLLDNTAQVSDDSTKKEAQGKEESKVKNQEAGASGTKNNLFLPADMPMPSSKDGCKKYIELSWTNGSCKRRGFKDLCMESDSQISKTIVKIRNFLRNYDNCDRLTEVLKQTTTIALKGQGITRLDPLYEFRGTIQSLDVSDNNISDISPIAGDLERPSTMLMLNISNNNLASILSLRNMKNLRFLDISRNPIKSLYSIKFLQFLERFYADHTTKNEIQFDSVPNENGQLTNRQLTELSLRDNELTDQIVAQFPLFNKLAILDLTKNSLTTTTYFLPMSSIEQLKLGSNHLVEVTGLAKYPTLEVLDLSNNPSILGLDGILGLTALTSLDLSGIIVQDLSLLEDLVRLNQLQANGSQVARLGSLEKLTMMRRFSIEGCHIQQPGDLELLKSWQELQAISVKGCILPDAFSQVAILLQGRGVFVKK